MAVSANTVEVINLAVVTIGEHVVVVLAPLARGAALGSALEDQLLGHRFEVRFE
jgi:hypothetical protein